MSSTFVLVSLLLSLSMAVLVPEIKDSKKTIFSFSPEYDHMVNKQRKGFLTIGLLAVSTFFISIQTLSVPIFVLHLVLDVLFGGWSSLVARWAHNPEVVGSNPTPATNYLIKKSIILFLPVDAASNLSVKSPITPRKVRMPPSKKILQKSISSILNYKHSLNNTYWESSLII